MTRNPKAEQCLVSICATLCLSGLQETGFTTWLTCLREVLPDAEHCPETMAPLWVAANGLARSEPGRDRDSALWRLRNETKFYFELAAANRFETWQRDCTDQVVE